METKEFQLLLHCAHLQPDATSISDLVSKELDWQLVLELARQHGIRPLLHLSLKTLCWNAVPRSVQIELEHFNRTNVWKNLLFTGELLKLVAAFQQNNVMLAAFKGPILAESVYGDLSLREFWDLDVLVHQTDIRQAEEILIAYGYQADFPDRDFRSTFLSYHGQYAFRNRETGISVDLHWQLYSKGMAFPFRSEEVWPKLTWSVIAGRAIPSLAIDDLALFLAAHGTKERWRNLLWVSDFAALLHKNQDIDWSTILDRARRSHSSRPFLLAIYLAVELLGVDAPLNLIDDAWCNSAVRALAKDAKNRMLHPGEETEIIQFISGLTTHDRLRDKLLPIVTLLTTRTVGDYKAIRLPKALWWLYFFIRPFRLALKLLEIILYKLSLHGPNRRSLNDDD